MKLRSMMLIAIASLSLTTPLALAQRPTHPLFAEMPHSPMMRRGGMMHEMQVNSEFEYLTRMIPHHQEAITTARLVLARSNRPEMQRFAQEIIRVQSAEIEQIQHWLKDWYPGHSIAVTYTPMMRDLTRLRGDALDQAFLEDMVMHHHGAVMMSHRLLNHNLVQHSPVRPFAQRIAHSQQEEIGQMQAWLRNWFGITHRMPGTMRHRMMNF